MKTPAALLRWVRLGDLPVILICALLLLPVAALAVISTTGTMENFRHIVLTIIPAATVNTLLLLTGVGIMTAMIGGISAWLVSYYEFPGARKLSWLLMLPLAVPTYISAYAFVEFLSYTGPVQTLVRDLGGFGDARSYWFPDVRSLGGTVLVMSLVLYPYVYLSVRTLFQFQGSTLTDTARTLGASGASLVSRVIFPLARPALVLGVALAMLETLNDIGAVEYMGTRTLTFSIFSVWLNQSDLAGAAQIALFLLLLVAGLLMLERLSRRGRRFNEGDPARLTAQIERTRLHGFAAWLATFACTAPVVTGFGIPVFVLGGYAWRFHEPSETSGLLEAATTSVILAGTAAFLAVLIGLLLAYKLRTGAGSGVTALIRLAATGYAIPGTLVALGIFLPFALFDNAVDAFFRSYFGISTGLLITGSGGAIIFAYLVRFMAMAEGSLDAGFRKISPNMDMAARSLGRNRRQVLREVLLPVLQPAIISAGLLVFVDSIKELSATIMLRPFGVNTLATHVYDFASRAKVEEAAIGCLLIILAGMLPVSILLRSNVKR